MSRYELGFTLEVQVSNAQMNRVSVDRFFRRLNRFGVNRIRGIRAGIDERRDKLEEEALKDENGALRVRDPFESWRRLGILGLVADSVRTRKEIDQSMKEAIARYKARFAS